MTLTMPIAQARNRLARLSRKLQSSHGVDSVTVTNRGKPVLALLQWDLYESLIETLEIMSDKDLMAALNKSIKQLESGKLVPWNLAKKRLFR
jgi:antitoxin YefM